MNLIDRDFLRQYIPDVKFSKMSIKMTVKNVGNQKYDASEFVVFQMFIPGRGIAGKNEYTHTELIQRKTHVIN